MKGQNIVKTFVKNTFAGLLFPALFLLVITAPVRAQVLAHSGEVAGTVGYDHTNYYPPDGPTSTHFFGASGGYNVIPAITVLGEYKYDPLGSYNLGVGPSGVHAQLYGGAVRFNFRPSSKIVPYSVVGGGGYRFTVSSSGSGISINGSYVNFGGGASVYLGKNWGVRPEVRYERQQFSSEGLNIDANVVVAYGSIFYQWGGTGIAKKQK
jgi:hypothetical protein